MKERGSQRITQALTAAAGLFTCVAAGAFFSGCLGQDPPVPMGYPASADSGQSASDSTALAPYRNAETIKIIFNKQNFYDNYHPAEPFCTAGDTKFYFDPQTDRRVPVQPSWLKNVAVELTNASVRVNDSTGACLHLAPAASATNCASFDDLLPSYNSTSNAVLVGGTKLNGSAKTLLNDIWLMKSSLPQATTPSNGWVAQNKTLPAPDPAFAAGRSWAGGDFDILHNSVYLYGGIESADAPSPTPPFAISGGIVKMTFDYNRGIATSDVVTPSSKVSYGGWLKKDWTVPTPEPRAGSTFTYSPRRDPSSKFFCSSGESLTSGTTAWTCSSTTLGAGNAIANNEAHDYFLLLGGLKDDGTFASNIYMFRPHGLSDDNATSTNVSATGDWNLLSYVDLGVSPNADIMPVSKVELGNSTPFLIEPTIFPARAYHRTVYDSTMNRFYIFGGLGSNGIGDSSTGTALVDNDIWIYEPPALGRKPNEACNVAVTPTNVSLSDAAALESTLGFAPADGVFGNLGILRTFLAGPRINSDAETGSVFPPGGCLLKVTPTSPAFPDARFEHSMAFDSDQKAVVMFGGCTAASAINFANTHNNTGDPTGQCGTAANLKDDLWIYVPPIVRDFDKTPSTDHLPLYSGDGGPTNAALSAPSTAQVLGKWIELSPGVNAPTARTGAAMYYDRVRHKFYLHGGFGLAHSTDATASLLNDFWEYTPPDLRTCDDASCSDQGSWKLINVNTTSNATQPPARRGAIMTAVEASFSHGDDFYTVYDQACVNQGPNLSSDSTLSKQFVGAIYVDLDRSLVGARAILINLRMLPFDRATRLPGVFDAGFGVQDTSSIEDTAQVRVQLLENPHALLSDIMGIPQPRFQEYGYDNFKVAEQLFYAVGGTGQVTDKQILIPLNSINQNANLIKIERVEGSIKFYEMTVTLF